MKKVTLLVSLAMLALSSNSQIYQLVTLRNRQTQTYMFVSINNEALEGRLVHGAFSEGRLALPFDSIISINTIGVDYEGDEFDDFLSGGNKIIKFEKVSKSSESKEASTLWVSPRLIDGKSVLLFKLRVKKNDETKVLLPDISRNAEVEFTFPNDQKLSCRSINSFLVKGYESFTHNFAYLILNNEEIKLLIDHVVMRIRIDQCEFEVEDPDLFRRFLLALNDEQVIQIYKGR
jgi:hypothetical protein